MSYRSRISVNPNINVQGLQSQILVNQHDKQLIQIQNTELNNKWFVQQLVLFADNTNISAGANIQSNKIDTLYLNPQQDITFFGGTNDISVGVFIDISFDGSHWFDSNFPVVKNSSADFSVNYHSQARYIRLRFNNTSASTKIIEKSYAAYRFNKFIDKSGVITSLDANTSFVTQ